MHVSQDDLDTDRLPLNDEVLLQFDSEQSDEDDDEDELLVEPDDEPEFELVSDVLEQLLLRLDEEEDEFDEFDDDELELKVLAFLLPLSGGLFTKYFCLLIVS